MCAGQGPAVPQPNPADCLLTGTSGEIFPEKALCYWALKNSNSVWLEIVFQCCEHSQEDMKKMILKKIYFFSSAKLISIAKN